MLRVLNDEEIKHSVQELHNDMFPYTSTELQDWEAIAKAQHQADLKAFVEWLEKHKSLHDPPTRGGEIPYNLVEITMTKDDWQSLKQLVEE